jgi:hypothetical protein
LAGTATSFISTDLAPRKTYTYRLRAQNAAGWSPYSVTVSARTR